jgi:hypothetical protein
MIISEVKKRGSVQFPEHTGERIYMVPFTKKEGLPDRFRNRWQSTVDQMLEGIDARERMFLMVDQRVVRASTTHRRPGMHIDGWWIPAPGPHPEVVRSLRDVGSHGTGRHSTIGCHGTSKGDHGTKVTVSGWPDEAILLASDVSACRAFEGVFEGEPGVGGDVTHIDLSSGKEIVFDANRVYSGNVTMIHESMAVPVDCLRTVVRINVPGVYI